MKALRIGLGLLFLGGIVVAALVLTEKESPDRGDQARPRWKSSRDCAACHPKMWEEIEASYHGMAFTDPAVLELSENFQKEECISCHAPMPIYGDDPSNLRVGERVFARLENRELGVDCLSCHLLPDGRIAAVRGADPDAPCRPKVVESFGTAQLCAGCHNQHFTVDEFMGSAWSDTHTCSTCHMPRVDRPLAKGGPIRKDVAVHTFPGGHSPPLLKTAATLETSTENGELVISVTNSGTGHNMPTDARHRSFNVVVTIRDENGNLLVDREEIAEYRLYYRDMKLESTQLTPFETRTHRYPLPSAGGRAVVELYYALKPPDKQTGDWTLVHRKEQDF